MVISAAKRICYAENGAAVVTPRPNGLVEHANCALFDTGHPFESVCDQILQKNKVNACIRNPFGALRDHSGHLECALDSFGATRDHGGSC